MPKWFQTLFQPVPQVGADPLAHPDIARMSQRELADLPLTPPPAAPGAREARRRLAGRATCLSS